MKLYLVPEAGTTKVQGIFWAHTPAGLKHAVEEQAEPEVVVQGADTGTDSQLQVQPQQAEVTVQSEGEALIEVTREEPNIVFEQAEPNILVEQTGEAEVQFTQTGEPTVTVEEFGEGAAAIEDFEATAAEDMNAEGDLDAQEEVEVDQ